MSEHIDTSSYEDEKYEYSLGELLNAPFPEERYLWNPFLPKEGLAALAGKPDSGKSMFARELALNVALGKSEFAGFALALEHRSALYVTTEDSIAQTQAVIYKQLQRYAPEAEEAKQRLHFLAADTLSPLEILAKLTEMLERRKFDLVVIDSYGDAFTGKDGNSNMEVRTALRPFHKLATENGCLVLFVSHINKAGYGVAPDQVHAQGAGSFTQKIRTLLDLRAGGAESGFRYLTVTKGNHVASSFKLNSLKLAFDERTLTFTSTGEWIPLERVNSSGPKATAIDWSDVFGDPPVDEMTTGDISKALEDLYGLQDRQARNRMARELVQTSRGYWSLPVTDPTL